MPNGMKALIKPVAARGARLIDLPIPEPGPGEVLVKVKAASICGTDVHIYTWDPWAQDRVNPPLVFGHEFAGDVVKVGPGVANLVVGNFVSAETHIVCNTCQMCRTGNAHVCQNYQIIGVDRQGCFAEYIVIPAANAWLNQAGLDPAIAALQEPLGNAVHTVFAGPVVAKTILIIGCGPIGLLAAGVAAAAGAGRIIAADVNPYRLELALRMGATDIIDCEKNDLIYAVTQLCGKVDVVYEMSGAPLSIAQGLKLLQNAGQMSVLGIPAQKVTLDITKDVVFKGVTLKGITGRAMYQSWYIARGLLESGKLNVQPLLTHSFGLAEYQQAFAVMIAGNSGKVTLIPD
ncbi:MAG: L-threonine 3-dehydrogenase [Peptococcaceae bacterium]|nr:L-threonine 3-dehydrogenase [Peptococcaceae bacterium]